MDRRRKVIKRKRQYERQAMRAKRRRRCRIADLLPEKGEALPILEEWDRLVSVGREIV
ncbi:hypothetical protein [Viridibacterium curvum]|uniref:30S ribosomal protein S14 n=1 Tax=Viridibacterium curvum TaxID=1101404 RepID=A0ABP9R7A6_9RHOO